MTSSTNTATGNLELVVASNLEESLAGTYVLTVTEHNTESSQRSTSFVTTVTVILAANPCVASPFMSASKWPQTGSYPEYDVKIGSDATIDLDEITNGDCKYTI